MHREKGGQSKGTSQKIIKTKLAKKVAIPREVAIPRVHLEEFLDFSREWKSSLDLNQTPAQNKDL